MQSIDRVMIDVQCCSHGGPIAEVPQEVVPSSSQKFDELLN